MLVINISLQKNTLESQNTSNHSTPLKSLENAMLEDTLHRRRRTPRKDLLEPTKGQSTPVNKHNDDPFGFNVLDSPLVFSPVLPSNNTTTSSSSQLQVSDEGKRQSFGTYDIPVKAKPTIVRKKKHKDNQVGIVTMVTMVA